MTFRRPARLASTLLACLCVGMPCGAGEFSVTPIRAELKAGALSETITVTNHLQQPLRVSVKLMEWTQDANGKDVYVDSSDLVYFPRQLDIPPEARRLVRIGAKSPAGVKERTYRLFIEEQAEASTAPNRAQVAFYFRFGLPVFLTPAAPRPQPEASELALDRGKLSVTLHNRGNQHVRLTKVTVSDGAGFRQELAGWYSLAGASRTYAADIPPDTCRRATELTVALEGEGLRIDRKLHVDPQHCS